MKGRQGLCLIVASRLGSGVGARSLVGAVTAWGRLRVHGGALVGHVGPEPVLVGHVVDNLHPTVREIDLDRHHDITQSGNHNTL